MRPPTDGAAQSPVLPTSVRPCGHNDESDDSMEDKETADCVRTPDVATTESAQRQRPMLLAMEHLVSPDSAELVACSPAEQPLPGGGVLQPGVSLAPLQTSEVQSACQHDTVAAVSSTATGATGGETAPVAAATDAVEASVFASVDEHRD